jgi:hypothetical protein
LLSAALLAAWASASTPGLADHKADPADRCTAEIQRAGGSLAKCLLRADARLTLSDDPARYDDRVERCERRYVRRHGRALRRFGADNCPEDSAEDLADDVFEATAGVSLAAASGSAPRLGPMTTAVRGMNYEPTPSNYVLPPLPIYFDTDFYNQDFGQLWGTGSSTQPGGRNDVGDMRSLGVNFIRLFNWDPAGTAADPFRDHEPWLTALGPDIYTAGVFSNGNRATAQAQMVVDQFNGFSSTAKAQVAVWLVGNEISPTDPFTLQTLAVIDSSAQAPLDTIPICVPLQMSSTQDAINKVKENYQQFVTAGLTSRFIACLNFYGLGHSAMDEAPADQLSAFITGFFADPFITSNNIELFFTEFGINFDNSDGIEPNAGGNATTQGTYLSAMLARSIALQARYPAFLGQAVFEYTNETWKTPNSEANFGLYSLTPQAPPLTGKTTRAADPAYPVDTLAARPQHTAVVDNY